MDAQSSFKSFSMATELGEQAFRRKTRKRLVIITLSTVVLVAVVIAAIVEKVVTLRSSKNHSDQTGVSPASAAESIQSMCSVTRYPDSCLSSMSSPKTSPDPEPRSLFLLSLQLALNELVNVSFVLQSIASTSDPLVPQALRDCEHLIEDAIDHVTRSISFVRSQNGLATFSWTAINDVRTWLSTAITDQETCVDGLADVGPRAAALREEVRVAMRNSTEFTSNSLAIFTNIFAVLGRYQTPAHRKLMEAHPDGESDYPSWLGSGEQRATADVTVAKDGSGNYRSIGQAVNAVPKNSESTFVIYIKEGVYRENVVVGKELWNVMMYGDGMDRTIVSGSLNLVDGVSTYYSGTFIAEGRGFVAKDMGFKNTAGPNKGQAVAFRSSSDKSVFDRCSFHAFQDTLYVHSNRQFYRDCHISGTIDFIFGDATVVFQNCTIQPRQPKPNQYNTITAQSKTDPNANTGFSIQRCTITPFDNLTAPTYLGRPWKSYSTTVVMQTYIGGLLDQAGWVQWEPDVGPPTTLFYAEYRNSGPGSELNGRVNWTGYKPNITDKQASEFTVESFIRGAEWLRRANVTYDAT